MTPLFLRPLDRQEPIEISLGSKTVSFEKSSIHLDQIRYENGKGWISEGNRKVPFYACKRNKILEIWMDGKTYKFEILQSSRPAATGHRHEKSLDIAAPMPGKILNLLAETGDKIKADEPLVVMESMKMEMTLSAHAEGTIAKINCKSGDLVEMGALLVEITP